MTRNLVRVDKLLLYAVGLITLSISPIYSYDSIILPKFLLLIIFGLILLLIILFFKIRQFVSYHLPFLILTSSFIIWSLISLLFSGQSLTAGFFGVPGRYNGVLTFLCYIVFMTIALLQSKTELIALLVNLLSVIGLITAIYGLIQYKGADPFDWVNENSPVFGFFGNPNFLSAFLGLSGSTAMALALNIKNRLLIRVSWMSYILFIIYIISKSKSEQGFIVLALSTSVVIFLWLITYSKLKKLKFLYIAIWIIGIVVALVDILQKSPWPSVLYKVSISYRGDFWRTGWNMTVNNPFFGVGFEGYKNNFRLYRDLVSANRAEISPNVDSAHNILLDISSSGGFPLLIIYLGLTLLTLVSAFKVVRRSSSFDFSFAGVLGAWVGYSAQSLISVNNISLSIWGWVLSGAIIGFEINGRSKQVIVTPNYDTSEILTINVGLLSGALLALPFLITDAQLRSTIRDGDVNKIMVAVQRWPQSSANMNLVTSLFRQGGFPDQSLVIARKAVKLDSKNFESWQQLYLSPNATESERKAALVKMREMDPLNPTLK